MVQTVGPQGLMAKHEGLRSGSRGGREDKGRAQNTPSEIQVTQTDVYVKVSTTNVKVTYDRPKGADASTIERLKDESEQAYAQLKDIVRQLLERQGLTFQDIFADGNSAVGNVEVDDQTVQEAQALLAEGGPFSPEAVSDRIVETAIAFSGGDRNKMGLMRSAIEAGFRAAEGLFGGQLPDISYTTYGLIQEKLDAWEQEGKDVLGA